MGMEERGSSIKKTLNCLCMSNGWSYGVFWRFDPRNNMLLTMEDAYYEDYVARIVDSMILQVHILGEGKVGEAALDGKHRWMFLDASDSEKCKFMDHTKGQIAWDDSEFGILFPSGMKTVAVIPVESRGVVQFGSTKEILESPEFLDQARKFLLDEHYLAELASAGSASSSLNSGYTNLNDGQFASMISSQNSSYGDVSTSWENIFESTRSCSTFDSLLPFSGETFDGKVRDQYSYVEVNINDPNLGSLVKDSIVEDRPSNPLQFEPVEFPASLFDPCQMDDLSQWLADSSKPCLEDVMRPVGDKGNPLPIHSAAMSISECISGTEGGSGSITGPRKGLFSELGLEHLFSDGSCSSSSITKSCIDDQWSTKKREMEKPYQTQLIGHSSGIKLIQPATASNGGLKGCMQKSQAGLWINDSCNMDAKSCITGVNTQTRRPEDPVNATKKRARPGESTRPRPKDRQMIADRIKELRDLIPSGAKLSIDSLLGRTVRQMLFMQNLTKHADKLKQVVEPKLIGQDNGLVGKGSFNSIGSGGSGGDRGATWAYEVGGTNLFCPILVEDLSHPGQMLIEMLCEERGYFLEIADIVRGLGLTILKGVMEAKDDKIWAQFIVEGNKRVTRMDVFVSLMQFLQGTSSSTSSSSGGVNTSIEVGKVVNNGALLYNNYQQHVVPLPV